MKVREVARGLGAVVFFAGILGSTAAAQTGDSVAGKAVFTKSCAGCHGAAGEGKESLAKALKVEMHHLGSANVQSKTDEQLRKDITEGVGKMKPVGRLSDQDVSNAIAYMRTLKQ
jgi:mono/diheme cytochrome c family protein